MNSAKTSISPRAVFGLIAAVGVTSWGAIGFALDCAGALAERLEYEVVEVRIDGELVDSFEGGDEVHVQAFDESNISAEFFADGDWQGSFPLGPTGGTP